MRLSSKGQTLIELTIVAGLTIMVIAGITIASVTSLKNNDFARSKSQATKLAQGSLEQVRIIKNRNWTLCLDSPPYNKIRWEDLYPRNFTNFEVRLNDSTCTPLSGEQSWLVASTQPDTSTAPFTRRLILEKLSNNEIKLTAKVSWNDSSGTHTSELVTIFSKQ